MEVNTCPLDLFCAASSLFTLHGKHGSVQADELCPALCIEYTRECFVYRSCSLLTMLVVLASLHAKIHCETAFGRASLSTPFSIAALLSALYTTGKPAGSLALTLLVEVLQMAGSLLKPGARQRWLNSWADCLQGVREN